MMPSSTTPATGAAGGHTGSHGYGLVLFASILLFVTGCFNMIQGIAAVANSHVFVAHAHYVFANLTTWGWVTAVLGACQLVAAAGVLAANQLFRWSPWRGSGPTPSTRCSSFRLPVLVADHQRHGCGRAVRALRLRQPRGHHGRLAGGRCWLIRWLCVAALP
jgi:hypothetical protein